MNSFMPIDRRNKFLEISNILKLTLKEIEIIKS